MGHNEKEKRVFGNTLIGTWYCPKCSYTIFPRRLKIDEDLFVWSNKSSSLRNGAIGPHCKKCDTPMDYDEAE